MRTIRPHSESVRKEMICCPLHSDGMEWGVLNVLDIGLFFGTTLIHRLKFALTIHCPGRWEKMINKIGKGSSVDHFYSSQGRQFSIIIICQSRADVIWFDSLPLN